MRKRWETEQKGGGSLREIERKRERWGREWNLCKKSEDISGSIEQANDRMIVDDRTFEF
jgi:hypothetical protein